MAACRAAAAAAAALTVAVLASALLLSAVLVAAAPATPALPGAYAVAPVGGVRMTTKVVGADFWVRAQTENGTAGDFAPFGFVAGMNLGASKPFHDPGEVPLTYNDYVRVRKTRARSEGGN